MAMRTPASLEFVDLKLRETAEAIGKARRATAVKCSFRCKIGQTAPLGERIEEFRVHHFQ
jgi:hypothetical protein